MMMSCFCSTQLEFEPLLNQNTVNDENLSIFHPMAVLYGIKTQLTEKNSLKYLFYSGNILFLFHWFMLVFSLVLAVILCLFVLIEITIYHDLIAQNDDEHLITIIDLIILNYKLLFKDDISVNAALNQTNQIINNILHIFLVKLNVLSDQDIKNVNICLNKAEEAGIVEKEEKKDDDFFHKLGKKINDKAQQCVGKLYVGKLVNEQVFKEDNLPNKNTAYNYIAKQKGLLLDAINNRYNQQQQKYDYLNGILENHTIALYIGLAFLIAMLCCSPFIAFFICLKPVVNPKGLKETELFFIEPNSAVCGFLKRMQSNTIHSISWILVYVLLSLITLYRINNDIINKEYFYIFFNLALLYILLPKWYNKDLKEDENQ